MATCFLCLFESPSLDRTLAKDLISVPILCRIKLMRRGQYQLARCQQLLKSLEHLKTPWMAHENR